MPNQPLWAVLKLGGVVALVVAAVAFLRSHPASQHLTSVEDARAFVGSMQPYDKPAFVLAYAAAALFLPGTLLSLVGALLYGVWWGTLLVWTGAVLGSLAPYGVARLVGRSAAEAFFAGTEAHWRRLDEWVVRRGFRGLLLVRFLPIFPYWLVNYSCGLLGVRFRDYVSATALGILPGTFVYQYLFANVGQAVLSEGLHWGYLTDYHVLAPVGALALFLLVGRWLAVRLGVVKSGKLVRPEGRAP